MYVMVSIFFLRVTVGFAMLFTNTNSVYYNSDIVKMNVIHRCYNIVRWLCLFLVAVGLFGRNSGASFYSQSIPAYRTNS